MTDKKRIYRGKQALPYLLSTTKTLMHCKRYYYTERDYQFNSKRNRDCYSERNVRINMTRMWHNIIIPNAILCRESGVKPPFEDLLAALNYAMINGKTQRSLAMWRQICQTEANLPKEQTVAYKYLRSYYFYVLGRAVSKDGLWYNLPKKKVIDLDTYTYNTIRRFLSSTRTKKIDWYSPWTSLNKLIYKWVHYTDEYDAAMEQLEAKRDKLVNDDPFESMFWGPKQRAEHKQKIDAEIAEVDKEIKSLGDRPEFPSTMRAVCAEFGVSMTTAKQFLDWKRQFQQYNWESYNYCIEHQYVPFAYRHTGQVADDKAGMVDTSAASKPDYRIRDDDEDDQDDIAEDNDETDDVIERSVQSVVNSGARPEGRIDDDEAELPL